MAHLSETGGVAATAGRMAPGFCSVLAGLTVPVAWGSRVVAGGPVGWPALLAGVCFTAACPSGLPRLGYTSKGFSAQT